MHNNQEVETTQVVIIDECTNKMWHVNIMEYHSALRRKESLTNAITRVKLENIMLSEVSQTPKDKYYLMPLV